MVLSVRTVWVTPTPQLRIRTNIAENTRSIMPIAISISMIEWFLLNISWLLLILGIDLLVVQEWGGMTFQRVFGNEVTLLICSVLSCWWTWRRKIQSNGVSYLLMFQHLYRVIAGKDQKEIAVYLTGGE